MTRINLNEIPTGDLVAALNNRGYREQDPEAEKIISHVADRLGITRSTLLTRHKAGKQRCAFLIREKTGAPWRAIADTLGYQDHSGAQYAAGKGKTIEI